MLCDFAWAGRPGAAGAQIMKDTWCVDVIFPQARDGSPHQRV